jgi:hypothetical protein
MKPIIVDKNSDFVIVTYWWGRGNLNKNLQRPCPEEISDAAEEGKTLVVRKKPIKYEAMIDRFEKSCKKHRCNYMAVEYPKFAKKGMYQDAINYKPSFILEALNACSPRGVLYIDGDMLIKRRPNIFNAFGPNKLNVDYIARGWNMDIRTGAFIDCYDPYVFETSGGTMYFGPTVGAKKLLKSWHTATLKNPGKAEDRVISQYINKNSILESIRILQIPVEYLWLTLDYVNDKRLNPRRMYIEHPECLTGEDRAAADGAASNRIPKRYDEEVTNMVKCGGKKVRFSLWEYVLFPTKRDRIYMGPYLDFLKKYNIVKYIDYDKKYGEYNKEADRKKDLRVTLDYPDATTVIVSTKPIDSIKYNHVVSKSMVIPTILKYISRGVNAVYLPKNRKNSRWMAKVKDFRKNEIDFACKNLNKSLKNYKKAYTLKIDLDYPMFFGCNSEVLKHLITMSKTFRKVDKIFNGSLTFISLIRCKWV